MFTTAIIAFREFLEAFLIIGIFLGVSKKLSLKRETEITFAAVIGIVISFILSITAFSLGDAARVVLTEQRAEILEAYLRLFSGFFLAYVVLSLHKRISADKKNIINKAKDKMQVKAFDFSLFATIVFLVVREGFEIALFTSSTSLFTVFFQNLIGLFVGFASASILGIGTFFAYTKLSLKKVFRVTEFMILLLGASLVQIGATELLEYQVGIHLSDIASFGMQFMPDEGSMIGHALQSFTGIDAGFSLPRFLIMAVYILGILIFIRQNRANINYEK